MAHKILLFVLFATEIHFNFYQCVLYLHIPHFQPMSHSCIFFKDIYLISNPYTTFNCHITSLSNDPYNYPSIQM